MSEITKPSGINIIWASGGDKLDPGNTKYQTGWGVEIPPRQWENYIQNKQDQAIAHFNQHGIPVWDAATEYQAGKSYTQGQTNGTIYQCILTHTNQDPELDVTNTYWIVAFASAGTFYTKTEADSKFLDAASNLSDLTNTATARTNLSVYSQAQTYTKTEVDYKTTVASQAQAESGTSTTVLMTPLRTAQYVAVAPLNMANASSGTLAVARGGTGTTISTGTGSNVLSASPALTGVPTAPTAALGTNTTQIATTAFARGTLSAATSGYQILPSGLILQWGIYTGTVATNSGVTVTLPIAFPTAVLSGVTGENSSDISDSSSSWNWTSTTTQITLYNVTGGTRSNVTYFVIGR